jgi:putative proteasome-type protease
MTYCLAIRLDQGLVFGSDSRTNAGVDYVTTYRKMHVFQPAPDRLFVVLSAGSLATTQEIAYHVQRDLDFPGNGVNLSNVRYLFEAAEYLGQVSQNVQQRHAPALQASGVSGETSLILGGQIQGQPPEIMLIYPQGNYITASEETPYLQIGESKYGKPVLDRFLAPDLSLEVGGRIALTSLEGTARSNVTVGPPFEIALYPRDSLAIHQHMRFEANSQYLVDLRAAWHQGLHRTLYELPVFDWET